MSNSYKSTLSPKDIPFKLPSNWSWYKWGDLIVEYQQGLIRSNRELNNNGVPYLKMNNLDNNGGYNLNKYECTNVTEEEIKRYKLLKGDFLLNVRNSKELVGKTCIIGNHDFDLVYNHMLVRIKHHDGISGVFINGLLKTPVMRKFIDRCKKGTTTIIALYQKDLYEIPIPIPAPETLNSITSFIENFSRKIEINNRINAELEAMAKTLYDYWFVQFNFPFDFAQGKPCPEPVEGPKTEGKPYKSSGGKMGWNEELKREIPEGWKVHKIGKLLYTSLGGTPSTAVKEYWENGIVNWLNSGEIANFPIITSELKVSEAALKNSAAELMPKGSVMLSITRHLRPSILGIDACANQSVVGIKEKGDIKCYFLYPYLKNEITRLNAMRTGAQQPHINKEIVDESLILIPNENSNLLQEYNLKVGPFYERIINNALQNQQLTSLRDWLLPMLMNGQVTVGAKEKVSYEVKEGMDVAAEPGVCWKMPNAK